MEIRVVRVSADVLPRGRHVVIGEGDGDTVLLVSEEECTPLLASVLGRALTEWGQSGRWIYCGDALDHRLPPEGQRRIA